MEIRVPATVNSEAVKIAANYQGCKSDKEFTLLGKKYPAGALKFKCFMWTRVASPEGDKYAGFYVYTDDVATTLDDACGKPTNAVCDLALVVKGSPLVVAPKVVRAQKKGQ